MSKYLLAIALFVCVFFRQSYAANGNFSKIIEVFSARQAKFMNHPYTSKCLAFSKELVKMAPRELGKAAIAGGGAFGATWLYKSVTQEEDELEKLQSQIDKLEYKQKETQERISNVEKKVKTLDENLQENHRETMDFLREMRQENQEERSKLLEQQKDLENKFITQQKQFEQQQQDYSQFTKRFDLLEEKS